MAVRRGRLAGIGAAVALVFAVLVGLGTWQLDRLAQKEALIALVAGRIAAAPTPPPPRNEWPTLKLADWEYRRIVARGTFDHTREARVYVALTEPRGPLKGPGYFLLTPLALDGGGTAIVNRGFAPEGRVASAVRPDGPVEIVGPLRAPEARNAFTPADDASKRLFFARDPAAIASALGLTDAAPFTIDAEATAEGGVPQGGETRVTFTNRHMEYALTWYGLAGALLAVFAALVLRTVREGSR